MSKFSRTRDDTILSTSVYIGYEKKWNENTPYAVALCEHINYYVNGIDL